MTTNDLKLKTFLGFCLIVAVLAVILSIPVLFVYGPVAALSIQVPACVVIGVVWAVDEARKRKFHSN